jgi:hypothetical protein
LQLLPCPQIRQSEPQKKYHEGIKDLSRSDYYFNCRGNGLKEDGERQ